MAGYPRHWEFDEVYDAVDRGCGDFTMDLRGVVQELAPGETLMIASRDAGAPVEIPAWCRLTGHGHVVMRHALIERLADFLVSHPDPRAKHASEISGL